MTKKWSSTKSMDGQTKRQASKKYRRDAINDVELALNGLEIDSVARLFETADDSVMVKLPLGALRQLARCRVGSIGNAVMPQIPEALGRAIMKVSPFPPANRNTP